MKENSEEALIPDRQASSRIQAVSPKPLSCNGFQAQARHILIRESSTPDLLTGVHQIKLSSKQTREQRTQETQMLLNLDTISSQISQKGRCVLISASSKSNSHPPKRENKGQEADLWMNQLTTLTICAIYKTVNNLKIGSRREQQVLWRIWEPPVAHLMHLQQPLLLRLLFGNIRVLTPDCLSSKLWTAQTKGTLEAYIQIMAAMEGVWLKSGTISTGRVHLKTKITPTFLIQLVRLTRPVMMMLQHH